MTDKPTHEVRRTPRKAPLVVAIHKAIQNEVVNLTEQAIESAVKDFEENLRRQIGQRVIETSDFYDIEQQSGRLVITVRYDQA